MARPLLKQRKEGALYERPKAVEKRIDAALELDSAELIARARVTDPSDSRFLQAECLVHLIREALRQGDDRTANALLTPLLLRCEASLQRTVPDARIPQAQYVREEILSSFGLMFAQDTLEQGDRLDYFECRFNRAFKALRITHIRAAKSDRGPVVALPESDPDSGGGLNEEALAQLSQAARRNPSQEDHTYLPQVLEAIDKLPQDEREAFVLCRILEYEVEANDPTKRTAATICGVTGRTIRNRLARADRKLKTLKEDL